MVQLNRHLVGSWELVTGVGIRGPYYRAVDTVCFPHTLHNSLETCKEQGIEVGMLTGPHFKDFCNHSNGLMSSAQSNGKALWRQYMGSSYPSPGNTRWGTHYETMGYFLPTLLTSDPDFIGPQLRPTFDEEHIPFPMTYANWVSLHFSGNGGTLGGNHIKYLFNTLVPGNDEFDPRLLALTEFEAAVAVDVSISIRYAIYQSEGDGPLAFLLSDILESVHDSFEAHFDGMTYPNVLLSLKKNVAGGFHPTLPDTQPQSPALHDAWVTYGQDLARRCRRHFYEKVYDHTQTPLYRELALFDPLFFSSKEASWNTQDTVADSLRAWFAICITGDKELIAEQDLDLLAAEVPAMRHRCQEALANVNNFMGSTKKFDVRCNFVELFWFKAHASLKYPVPTWSKYASKLMLLQPLKFRYC